MVYNIFTFEGDETKQCKYCNEVKPLSAFAKHVDHYDGYDSRCRKCKTSRETIVRRIRKNAPPQPERCDCCGKIPNIEGKQLGKFCCDHDPVTNEFRGWICKECNTGLGLFSDNVEGLQRAIDYLENNKQRYLDKNKETFDKFFQNK